MRRILSIDWLDPLPLTDSTSNIVGIDGELERSVTFGDPQSFGNPSLSFAGADFIHNKRSTLQTIISVPLQENRRIPIIDGPIFKPSINASTQNLFSSLPQQIQKLISLGAWVPNMTNGGEINLEINELEEDCVYEIRILIADGRPLNSEQSKKITLNPGGITFEAISENNLGTICVGKFISPEKRILISLKSENYPPNITCLVVRRLGYSPRSILSVRLA